MRIYKSTKRKIQIKIIQIFQQFQFYTKKWLYLYVKNMEYMKNTKIS